MATQPKASAPRLPGAAIVLAGETYIVPPLALRDLKQLQAQHARLARLNDGPASPELVEAMLELCLAAIRRNYPQMEMEALLDAVDIKVFPELVNAAMGRLAFAEWESAR